MWRVASALAGLFRARGIADVDQLVCLLADPRSGDLATEVVEALLNNETYFFRDHQVFDRLAHRILPELRRRRSATRRIAIWSAGCSTGQEPLSLAMLFADDPAGWDGWDIDIVGTDISGKAIAAARSGLFSQFEIQRGIDVARMLRHFAETSEGWRANDALRKLVRFHRANLLDAPPAPGRFDLVLCRNVLLYFDGPTRAAAFARLAESMAADGMLMMGSGETVVGQTDLLECDPDGSSLYRKRSSIAEEFDAPCDTLVGKAGRSAGARRTQLR